MQITIVLDVAQDKVSKHDVMGSVRIIFGLNIVFAQDPFFIDTETDVECCPTLHVSENRDLKLDRFVNAL